MPQVVESPTSSLARFEVAVRDLLPPGQKASEEAILEALSKARGSTEAAEIAIFKEERPALTNPFPQIPTSDIALARIKRAIENKEKIAIIGDYDVDGTISTVLLFEFLSRAGNKAACFIPDRIEDDYGVTQKAADKCMAEHKPSLIISVDCGSTSVSVIRGLKEQGVDFIVLDHHECAHVAADHPAIAHLNPKAWPKCSPLVDEAMSFCAGGLVFFFVDYLSKSISTSNWSYDRALILAGMATVADVMPLTRTNRAIVKHSLAMVNRPEGRILVPGIAALVEKAGNPEFTSRSYGWVIGPHLNAAGRVTHARTAANLVASRDPARIAEGVEELIAVNKERKAVQEKVQDEAMLQAAEQIALKPDRKFLVLFGDNWHPGVVGIVAGRIRERFRLPTMVCGLHPDGGYFKGSARGIRGCELGNIVLAAVSDGVILGGGGHQAAAGVRVAVGAEQAFRDWLEEYTADVTWDTVDVVEAVGDYGSLTPAQWAKVVLRAGPFGNASPEPVMMLRDCKPTGATRTLVTGNGRPFGISFSVVEVSSKKEFKLSWLGLAGNEEIVEAEALLRSGGPMTFAVRQTSRERNGMTFLNLDIVGLPSKGRYPKENAPARQESFIIKRG